MKITEKLNNKRILIWGYGREGQSTKNFLDRNCPQAKVDVFEGKREGINEDDYDFIIKSPGIVMLENHEKYTSQTELFLEEFSDKTIGITGTKGKSTTSAMMYHALKNVSDRKVLFLGNIGEPCLNYYEEITDDTIIVFEMSCHQLANVVVSPHIGIFLNLFEEHLDYYGTLEKYFAAKSNITKYQTREDVLYVGDNVPKIDTQAKTVVIRRDEKRNYNLPVYGEHNDYNAEFVISTLRDNYGITKEKVITALSTFKGLSHRLEYVGEKNGILFYDDSISTIPQATIEAVSSLPQIESVLIGGMDRGINYEVLEKFIQEHDEYNYIFMYESGKRISEKVGTGGNRFYVDDLKKAVDLAKEITSVGMGCVMSPAAASYGYFRNFEDRGEKYKEYIGLTP